MKKIITLLLLLFSTAASYAQWEPLNPKPSYFDAKKVQFVTPQTGFIVNGSQLLQTTDAGVTWAIKQTLEGCNDIKFINETGYIACNNGNIYKSTDSGDNWLPLTTGSTEAFFKVCMVDSSNIIVAAASILLATTDGGATWATIQVPYSALNNITTMCFTSALTGHIGTGSGSIYKTTDGGATWSLTVSTNSFPSGYVAMYFVNQNLGFVSQEYSNLYRTTDGGETWQLVSDSQMSMLIYDIYFTSNTTGYACGENNAVYKTANGGTTWTRLDTPDYLYATSHLYGIYAIDNTLFTVGMSGAIYKSANYGSSFSRYSPTYRDITKLAFADATTAYALSINSDVYKSTDTGNTWLYVSSIFNTYSSAHDLVFVNATTGYTILAGGLEKTIDGGLTWNYTEIIDDDLYCVTFIDAFTGFVSGGYNGPVTKRTTDGGATWQTVINLRFGKMQFLNASVGYARSAGFDVSTLYKTTDGGTTWNEVYATDDDMYDFDFTDENTGYIAGYPGMQRKTTDGGATWQEMPNFPYMYASIIRFGDANNGYTISDYGEIYKTTDGGDNWLYNNSIATNDLVYHGGNVYLGGTNGKILGTSSDVPLSTPQLTAKTQSLYVYPNPATTSFNINAGGAAITSVQLYDIAGRQLTPQGINFTGNGAFVTLPQSASGIYIANVILANGSRLSKKIVVN